jgi:zinc protease
MAKLQRPEHLELSNGIPVILQHYDGPVAATYWWVKTGSADESPSEAGFAHFLEHMLFKDAAAKETGKASTGKMARAVESLGGDINAYTSFDQTVYHVTCASTHWLRILDAWGAIAKPQRFLKGDFDREREVILEELRKNEDSPGRQLFQSLFSQTFKKHAYGKPVIGFTETLKAARVNTLESFYQRSYVSGQMGLVLVGPIDGQGGTEAGVNRQQILRHLEKHFGKAVLKPKLGSARPRPSEPELRAKAAFVVKPFDVKTPTLSFSFRVPDLMHEDVPALDLLAGVLGMGELSRLHQKLFVERSMVTDVSGGMYVPKDPGMLYFQAELDSIDKVNDAAEEMFKELKRIREEGPEAEELARVIVNAESERLYATQSADGMASRLGFLKFIVDDLEFDQKYLEELRAVDVAKIREVARKYLDPRRMSGVVMVPKENAGFKIAPIEVLAREVLGTVEEKPVSAKASKAKAARPPVEIFKLPSGIRVAHYPRPQSHVFSVHASALGGVRLEAPADWGTAYMMSLVWAKGTGTRDSREIARITEGSASSIDGFSGRNSVGAQVTGLARDWEKLSGLFSDVLLNPSFPDSEVTQYKRVAEDAIRGVEDHSSQLCSKLFLETLFEKHPYGRMTMGSLETLARIDGEKLRAHHRRWLRPERLVVSVSGDVPRAAMETWLGGLDQWARALKAQGAGGEPAKVEDEAVLKAPRWVEKNLGREQLHILVGGLGTQIHAEDRHALQIMQTLLGGQSGRLFIELREKKSLAYTVSPVSFDGLERGYVGTYIACSPSKRDEALAGIRKVLGDLAEKGPIDKEMERAKEFYLGRRAMDLQGDSSLAAHYGLEVLYDLPVRSEAEIAKRIRSVTAKEVREVCRKYLVEPHMVTSVVG